MQKTENISKNSSYMLLGGASPRKHGQSIKDDAQIIGWEGYRTWHPDRERERSKSETPQLKQSD